MFTVEASRQAVIVNPLSQLSLPETAQPLMGFLHLAFLCFPGWPSAKVLFCMFPRGLDWLYNSRFLWRVHDTHALNFTVATLALVAFRGCGLRWQDSRLSSLFYDLQTNQVPCPR